MMNGYEFLELKLKQIHVDFASFKLIFVMSELYRLNKLDDEEYYNFLTKSREIITKEITRAADDFVRVPNMSPNEI